MPVKSKAQYRAMQAAAHGKSNKGIPKKVAKEFLSHSTKANLPERKRKK
jgi:hypothetical protein